MSKGQEKLLKVAITILTAAPILAASALFEVSVHAAPRKGHTVVLGAVKQVPYSKVGDPGGAASDEKALRIRPLLVDTVLKEWTTGSSHDVTDRTFVVRRVLRINDTLPGDKLGQWVWQRGPWLMVDRVTGRVTPLKLPDYDPGVSQVSWFRDYAAYCGVTSSGKSLYAVVAQLAVRKPILSKKLTAFDEQNRPDIACDSADWQRDPLRITFHPTGKDVVSFDIVPGSAVLVEDSSDDPAPPAAAAGASAQ
jgi:hypothetical protein